MPWEGDRKVSSWWSGICRLMLGLAIQIMPKHSAQKVSHFADCQQSNTTTGSVFGGQVTDTGICSGCLFSSSHCHRAPFHGGLLDWVPWAG